MRKSLSITVAFALAMAFTISCSSDNDETPSSNSGGEVSSSSGGNPSSSSISVVYGPSVDYGETYKTIIIGTQTWLQRNLNIEPTGANGAAKKSICYENKTSNCEIYGRLYDWATAMALPSSCNSSSCSNKIQPQHRGICPENFHIPSNADWDKLLRYVDGDTGTESPYESKTAGRYLKATDGWYALPGGNYYSSDYYVGGGGVGDSGFWWSASEKVANSAYLRAMDFHTDEIFYWILDATAPDWPGFDKSYLFSVRCVQDF